MRTRFTTGFSDFGTSPLRSFTPRQKGWCTFTRHEVRARLGIAGTSAELWMVLEQLTEAWCGLVKDTLVRVCPATSEAVPMTFMHHHGYVVTIHGDAKSLGRLGPRFSQESEKFGSGDELLDGMLLGHLTCLSLGIERGRARVCGRPDRTRRGLCVLVIRLGRRGRVNPRRVQHLRTRRAVLILHAPTRTAQTQRKPPHHVDIQSQYA